MFDILIDINDVTFFVLLKYYEKKHKLIKIVNNMYRNGRNVKSLYSLPTLFGLSVFWVRINLSNFFLLLNVHILSARYYVMYYI